MENFLDQQHFVMELESQQKLVRRANGFSVLVLIDLDSFDNIKDQYGDLVAAMAIKNFSSFLDSSLRRSDICSHYGGKTFAIVMPATNAIQAEKKINSIKKEFSELDQSRFTSNFTITFSAGIATITSVTLNVNSVIEAANAALSEAKSAGYNLVKVAP